MPQIRKKRRELARIRKRVLQLKHDHPEIWTNVALAHKFGVSHVNVGRWVQAAGIKTVELRGRKSITQKGGTMTEETKPIEKPVAKPKTKVAKPKVKRGRKPGKPKHTSEEMDKIRKRVILLKTTQPEKWTNRALGRQFHVHEITIGHWLVAARKKAKRPIRGTKPSKRKSKVVRIPKSKDQVVKVHLGRFLEMVNAGIEAQQAILWARVD